MIITDKDGEEQAIQVSQIFRAFIDYKTSKYMDNGTFMLVIVPIDARANIINTLFATEDNAKMVLRQIDARMEAIRNHWNPSHNVPPLAMPDLPPLYTMMKTTNLSQQQPDVTSGEQNIARNNNAKS